MKKKHLALLLGGIFGSFMFCIVSATGVSAAGFKGLQAGEFVTILEQFNLSRDYPYKDHVQLQNLGVDPSKVDLDSLVVYKFDSMYAYDDGDFHFAVDGRIMRTRIYFRALEMQAVLDHYRLEQPSDLTGMAIATNIPLRVSINMLALQIKHGGMYTAPSKSVLFNRTVNALSQMKCPDFSDVDVRTNERAFRQMQKDNPSWTEMEDAVSLHSQGKVRLEWENRDLSGYDYFKLRGNGITKDICFAQSYPTMRCDEE